MSLRFQADNDLNHAIVRGVLRHEPSIVFLTARQSDVHGLSDPELLDWASANGFVVVSHDRKTMLHHFRNHLRAGKHSPGLIVVAQSALIGPVCDALVVMWAASDPEELTGLAYHVPSMIEHRFPR